MTEVEPTISYSLREVLGRLESKLDRLVDTIALKADRTEVLELDKRVGQTEVHITELRQQRENDARSEKERTEHRRWLWPTIAAFLAAVSGVLGALALYHPHA